MTQYRISDSALSDITDILKHSEIQFGTAARVRYQELLRTAIEDLADVQNRVASCLRDEVALGLRSFHLIHSRKRAASAKGMVQRPRHVIFYRLADDQVIEIVRILHDAMEAKLHLPQD